MDERTDGMLLRRYSAESSEAAFEELVRRHLNLVYAAAVRLAGPALAEDVSQMVFMAMAQKARELSGRESVAGWLHTTTRFVAVKLVRKEARRTAREREAMEMNPEAVTNEPMWGSIKPHLDEALGRLEEKDRTAVLLRFFEGLPHNEIARALRISEDAAQKRVARALERLHGLLVKQAPSMSVATLGGLITSCGTQASPAGLLGAVSSFCTGCTAAVAPTNIAWGTIMTMKTKVFAGAVLVTAVLVPTVLMERSRSDLEAKNKLLGSEIARIQTELDEQKARLRRAGEQADLYKAQAGEVHRLRAEVTQLRAEQAARVAAEDEVAEEREQAEGAQPAVLPWNEMTEQIAALRLRAFGRGEPLTPEEKEWLAGTKAELEKLEQFPAEFAEFQSGLIRSVARLSEPDKIGQIRTIIEATYQDAVGKGLDVMSRPEGDDAVWKQRRHELDRAGTAQVQAVLTEEERALFDRHFLGIMGVDLGTGVDSSLYPEGFMSFFVLDEEIEKVRNK